MTKVFLAGHNGMVGNSIKQKLQRDGNVEILTQTKNELNLLDQSAVQRFFNINKPDQVIIAAAKVGGIYANNKYPGQFIYENLQIQNNIIHSSLLNDVNKLLFLGSSCIYPKFASQPISEPELLSGLLEPTNEPYAIAKIAGIKMCESYNRQYGCDYRSVMPTNLYGPGDNYHPKNSHVIPALIRRFSYAKQNNLDQVTVWGTGNPRREFLYVDDMVEASLMIHNLSKDEFNQITSPTLSHVNIGSGKDFTIREIAETIGLVTNYNGRIFFDSSMPDGTAKKLLDNSKLQSLGWTPKIDLIDGLKMALEDYLNNDHIEKSF